MSKQQQTVTNRKLLKFLVMNGIPFGSVNTPFFLDFVASLNVKYSQQVWITDCDQQSSPSCFIVSGLDCSSNLNHGKVM